MKLSLLILALAIGTFSCQEVQPYTQVLASDIQNNPTIQYLANFGAQSVAQEAIQVGDLPNAQYNISRIYSVSQQSLVNGINYEFDVEISSPAGNSTRATYIVNYQPADNDEEVTSYTYERGQGLNNVIFGNQDDSDVDYSDNQALLGPDVLISEGSSELEWLGEAWIVGENEFLNEDNLDDGYSPIDLATFNNDEEAQNLFVFGLQDVINQIIDRGDLEDDYPFEITQIYNVEEETGNSGNYRYDVGIDNRNGTTGRIVFVALEATQTAPRRVNSYSYSINTVNNNQPITLGSNSESSPVDDALDGDIDDDDDSDLGGYDQVDEQTANNDASIQSAQNNGAQYVVRQGIATGVLPDGQYQVTRVFSVYQQVVNGINYRFDVELSNGQGKLVRAQYIVYSQPRTNTERVSSYKFTT